MTRVHALLAATVGAALLSGTALAAPLQPVAGVAPYEGPSLGDVTSNMLQRRDVEMDAAMHRPATGPFNAQGAPQAPSMLTRAQVRQDLLDAVAHGFRIGID